VTQPRPLHVSSLSHNPAKHKPKTKQNKTKQNKTKQNFCKTCAQRRYAIDYLHTDSRNQGVKMSIILNLVNAAFILANAAIVVYYIRKRLAAK